MFQLRTSVKITQQFHAVSTCFSVPRIPRFEPAQMRHGKPTLPPNISKCLRPPRQPGMTCCWGPFWHWRASPGLRSASPAILINFEGQVDAVSLAKNGSTMFGPEIPRTWPKRLGPVLTCCCIPLCILVRFRPHIHGLYPIAAACNAPVCHQKKYEMMSQIRWSTTFCRYMHLPNDKFRAFGGNGALTSPGPGSTSPCRRTCPNRLRRAHDSYRRPQKDRKVFPKCWLDVSSNIQPAFHVSCYPLFGGLARHETMGTQTTNAIGKVHPWSFSMVIALSCRSPLTSRTSLWFKMLGLDHGHRNLLDYNYV